MKTYIEKDGFIYNPNSQTWINKSEDNTFYKHILQEVEDQLAIVTPFVVSNLTWSSIRATRNFLLKESDWIGLSDATSPRKEEWMEYRQRLRNITNMFPNPESVVWPVKPE